MGRLANLTGLVLALPALDGMVGTTKVRFDFSQPEGL